MSTAHWVALALLIAIFAPLFFGYRPSKPIKQKIDYTEASKGKRALQSLLPNLKRSTMDQAMSGLHRYADMALAELERAASLGILPTAAREFAIKELEKKSVCGAFVVDIEVDMHVKFLGESSQVWSLSSRNNEFNRLYQLLRNQNPSVFTLGCTMFEQKKSGGSLSVQLFSSVDWAAPEALKNAPKTGAVHADIHAISPELKTYATYESVSTKKIPFVIFLSNLNENQQGDEAAYDHDEALPPEQEDHARLFLIVRPLTLLNPLYQGSDKLIEILQKNKDIQA